MNEDEFSKAIRKGLGRIIPYLQTHDAQPFIDTIMYACLHNTAYDPQCEGSRAAYLFEIIQLTGQEAFFMERITKQLYTTEAQDDLVQLFELTRRFAQTTFPEARQTLYQRFEQFVEHREMESEIGDPFHRAVVFLFSGELMVLDGLDGFVWIADCLGSKILRDQAYLVDECVLSEAQEQFGESVVSVLLSQLTPTSQNIAAYATAIDKNLERIRESPSRTKDARDYQSLKTKLLSWEGNIPRSIPMIWGKKHATDQELIEAANDMLNITDPPLLTAYLRIFSWRQFPLDHVILMQLAQTEDKEIAAAALQALSNITHPDIRNLGIELLSARKHIDVAIELLTNNLAAGDLEIVYQALDSIDTSEDWHDAGFAFERLIQSNPTPEAQEILIMLYENTPCSYCRRYFIEEMAKSLTLPEWILSEARFDSDYDTRAFCLKLTEEEL